MLARAERELGLDSHAIAFFPTLGKHPVDEILGAGGSKLAFEARRWRLLARAITEFDVIHFNFGRTILPPPPTWADPRLVASVTGRLLGLRDLPLLRRARKRIVVTFQGDDARQGDVLRARYRFSIASENPGYYDPAGDRVKRNVIATFNRYADRIFYLNPDLAHVLPPRSEFLPYPTIDPREWKPVAARSERPLVVHAPSDRAVKGTRYVVEAVERLRRDGVPFDFRLVENVSREEARAVFESADLGVDQLLAGWYGSFGVELMALGKPLICFVRDEDLAVVPADMRRELPIVSATPATIYDTLRATLAQSAAERAAIGDRCRRYVERWHDPRAVARRLKDAYERIVPGRPQAASSAGS
jgi:hypothetical protein